MDIRQLDVFCKVVELKGFSKAAEQVLLRQPTISTHIKTLEEEIGCKLFDRIGREAIPTKAGKILYEYALKILDMRKECLKAMDQFLGKVRGEFVIGGSTIPGEYVLPSLLGKFKKEYPDISIKLVIEDTSKIIAKVSDGKLDIGVVGAVMGNGNLKYFKFMKDELVLIFHCGHRWSKRVSINIKELLEEPIIIRESGSGSRSAMLGEFEKAGISIDSLKIIAEMGSTEAIIQGAKSGVGVSVISKIAVIDYLKSGILKSVKIKGVRFLRDFYIVIHKKKVLSPLADAFLNFLLKESIQK